MKYEIEIPAGIIPKGKRPVEFRPPNPRELYISNKGELYVGNGYQSAPRLILADEPPDWTWPEWLACDELRWVEDTTMPNLSDWCYEDDLGFWRSVPFAILNHPAPPDRSKVYRREDYRSKDDA